VDLNKLSLGDKIVGATGIVLLIDLLFFPWHKVDLGFDIPGVADSVTRKAIQSPNAVWGWLALLVALAIVAAVIIRKLTTTQLPDLPVPWPRAIFFGTIAVLVLLLIKLISETDFLAFGAYLAILLGAGMVYGGFLISKETETAPGTAPPTPF
jgi:hypothetical protein